MGEYPVTFVWWERRMGIRQSDGKGRKPAYPKFTESKGSKVHKVVRFVPVRAENDQSRCWDTGWIKVSAHG